MSSNELRLAFIYSEEIERMAMEPIANEASSRGYQVTVTTDQNISCDIAFAAHPNCHPKNASIDLSVIMFHGIDRGYSKNNWPNADWSRFDIGLLPGRASVENWKSSSYWPQARPRIGVFKVGWPKSDRVFSDGFKKSVEEFRDDLGLVDGKTILYAPTTENGGKIHEFYECVKNQADNILIKHAPYDRGQYINEGSLEDIYNKYNSKDKIHIIKKGEDIFTVLGVADILVSDESSVLQEAALTETVPISVTDWPIKDRTADSLTYDQVPPFAIKTSRDKLGEKINRIFKEHDSYVQKVNKERKNHYSNIGHSSQVVIDLVESIDSKSELQIEPIQNKKANPFMYQLRLLQLKSFHNYKNFTNGLIDYTPQKIKKILKILNVDKINKIVRDFIRPKK